MGGLGAIGGVGSRHERRVGQRSAQSPACRWRRGRTGAGGRGDSHLCGWWQEAIRSGPEAGPGQVGGKGSRAPTACDRPEAGLARRSRGTGQARGGGEAAGPGEGQTGSGRADCGPSREAGSAREACPGTNSGAGRKVATEKPAPAERAVAQKPAAAPSQPPRNPLSTEQWSEPAAPRPEKKQAPVAPPATNKAQEATDAYQRGNAKLLNGAPVEAIAAFSEALKLNPKDVQSQRGLGMAYAQAGNAAQAVHHYKLYLKASPNAADRTLIQKRIDQLGGR